MHLDKTRRSVVWMMVRSSMFLAVMLVTTGCLGPSPAERPEVELEKPQEETRMEANVQREGGKVWIEGVEGWDFAQKGSSVHAAMATVMRAIGEDVSYEYLLGTSAVAFRMQVHNEWCPSSPHPWCGYQCVGGSVNALPWKVKAYEVKPDDADGVREARAAVVASIDRGVPCAYGSKEDGVIYGYQKGGEEWLCVHPFRGGKSFIETSWPWGIGVYTERKTEMPDRRELVLASLKQAVEMAHTENVEEYDCGFHAWEQWIARLRDEQWVAQRSENESGLMMGNSWIYCCLVDYRGAAAGYLRLVADDLGGEATDHLRKAADFYQQMVEDVLLAGDCPLDVAPRPEDLKEGQQWTQAMRTEQARRLEAAVELERQAIAEIEKALAAEGVRTMGKPQARLVKLEPMRVAYHVYVGEEPEGPAIDAVINWAADKGLLSAEKDPRFLGFNNPDPSKGTSVYGYEFWMVVDEGLEEDDVVRVKDVEGGLYVGVLTEGVDWNTFNSLAGPWMEENGYEHDQSRQWLEGHVPNVDRLPEFPDLDGKARWIGFDLLVPIAPAKGSASTQEGAPQKKGTAVKMLEGLQWQQHTISQLGCIEGCLKYLGSDISSAWLFGGTGHAFVINIQQGLDPSGPTAWDWSAIHDLGPNLGYTTERIFCRKEDAGDTYPDKQKEAWDFVRAAIDRGVPCYGWEVHPWIPDYYVINGYDDTGYYYSGWESGGPLEWQKLGDMDVKVLQAFSVERCEPAADEKVLKDMLAHVLPRVAKPDGWINHPGYTSGQPAFEAWAKEVEEGRAIKDGHAYNALCWHECRAMAVEFLQEAKKRLAGKCDADFGKAIADYTVVRDRLKAVADLHPMSHQGWDGETKVTSPEAAALLREASAAEQKGIDALRRIAAAL